LQNGQQPPLAATLVAAVAVVPNTASTIAIKPTSFAFIVCPSRLSRAAHPLGHKPTVRLQADLKVKGLDLQVGLKVLPY